MTEPTWPLVAVAFCAGFVVGIVSAVRAARRVVSVVLLLGVLAAGAVAAVVLLRTST